MEMRKHNLFREFCSTLSLFHLIYSRAVELSLVELLMVCCRNPHNVVNETGGAGNTDRWIERIRFNIFRKTKMEEFCVSNRHQFRWTRGRQTFVVVVVDSIYVGRPGDHQFSKGLPVDSVDSVWVTRKTQIKTKNSWSLVVSLVVRVEQVHLRDDRDVVVEFKKPISPRKWLI